MKQKTHEQFITEMNQLHPNIEVLGQYTNSKTHIQLRCKKDGYQWSAIPNSLLRGHGCPRCSKQEPITQDVFVDRVRKMHPNIEVCGTYKNESTKVLCRCRLDNHSWYAKPNGLFNGYGCRVCGYSKVGKLNSLNSHDVQARLDQDGLFELIGEYTTLAATTRFRCKACGYEWEDAPRRVLRRKNCPKACSTTGERLVMDYLDRNKIVYHREFRLPGCKAKKELYFDFYLPEKQCVIEYDGQQHFMPVSFSGMDDETALRLYRTNVWRDKIKDRYCEQHNILMIRIPYTEADHIEQILDEQLLKRMEAHFWYCWSYRHSDSAWRNQNLRGI